MTSIPKILITTLKDLEPRFIRVATKSKQPIDLEWPTNRLEANNPILQDWLQKGGNYGVVGGNGLVILDADTKPIKQAVLDHLPRTFTVKSPGSGGWHAYYLSDLKRPIRLYDENHKNVGDVQGEGKMVVGPNSTHPCGGKYFVLSGRELAKVTEDDLREALGKWTVSREQINNVHRYAKRETQLLNISIFDVVSSVGWRKQGHEYYGAHPTHGSTTGQNFWINPNKDCWHCFRHNTGGGPLMWLAVEEGIIRCEEALPGALRGDTFRKVLEVVENRGFKIPKRLEKLLIFRGDLVTIGDVKMRLPTNSYKVTTRGYKV